MLMLLAGQRHDTKVDIFNATSGKWTTAALSVARSDLAAISLPDQGLAIFAGGTALSKGMFFLFDHLMLHRAPCSVVMKGIAGFIFLR
jgi:hypothetical protein